MNAEMPTYVPPPFLVIDPINGPVKCGNGDDAIAKAREIAQANPQSYIDIYQHSMCMRVREDGDAPDAG